MGEERRAKGGPPPPPRGPSVCQRTIKFPISISEVIREMPINMVPKDRNWKWSMTFVKSKESK